MTMEVKDAHEITEAEAFLEAEVEKALEGVPDRIRKIRGKRSRREFAKALGPGVYQNMLLKYENKEVRASIEFIIRLAIYEDIPPAWILLGEE